VNRQRGGNCKGKDKANSGWFDDETKGFVVVDARLLGEAADNPTSFVAGERTIRVVFVMENPLATNNVCIGRWRNERPGLVED
jgi:hypothetical protein